MLPMKKAMTVVMTAEVVVFAKRVKFGVALPPETKLPMTRPIAVTVVIHCGDHRVATEDCDQGHRDEGDDFDGLDSEVSGSGHESTCNDDDRPGADSQGFSCGDAEHRNADTEPTHLREGDECRGEVGTDTSEGVAGHEVEAQSGLCADVAQGSGVDGQDRAADDHRPHVL